MGFSLLLNCIKNKLEDKINISNTYNELKTESFL